VWIPGGGKKVEKGGKIRQFPMGQKRLQLACREEGVAKVERKRSKKPRQNFGKKGEIRKLGIS